MLFTIIHIPSLDSTNNHIQLLLQRKDLPEGTVIRTDEQTNGQGHGNNRWESEPGENLLFSLLLKPEFIDASQQFLLNEIVSLAIVNLLKKYLYGKDVKIKWPNDIYVENKKIAGILIQNTIRGTRIAQSIVGVGLNINQQVFSENLPNPVTLAQLTGRSYDISEILDELLALINEYYTRSSAAQDHQQLRSAYYSNLFRFEEWSNFREAREFKAKIRGINEYGQLRLELESGEIREVGFKEIEFVI